MQPRTSIWAFALVLLATGCGGGGQQQAQQGGGEETAGRGDEKVRLSEIARGKVVSVNDEKRRISVRTEDEKLVSARYRPENVRVKLDGEQAEPAAIEQGQRVVMRYREGEGTKDNERNRIRILALFSESGDDANAEEQTESQSQSQEGN